MRRLIKKLGCNSTSTSGTDDGTKGAAHQATPAVAKKNVKIQSNIKTTANKCQKGTSIPTPPAIATSTCTSSDSEKQPKAGMLKCRRSKYKKLNEEGYETLEPSQNILLPHLQENEKKFLEAVDSGDTKEAHKHLASGVNVNCINFQGITALHIAVQNEDYEMVEFLLKEKDIEIGDSVLIAIRDNYIDIVKMLLDKLKKTSPGLEFAGATHSSDFADHITPLVLAAQCGHYEIIEMLIERGHKIAKPHPPNCMCTQCKDRLKHDDLLHSETLRLNLYRAVSNPAYICHSTQDPILAAFHLSRELKKCAFIVRAFRAAYTQLAEEISLFAVELIGHCRSTAEMELILRQKNGLNEPTSFKFPRIILAVDYKQIEFIAHPNTQQIIESVWHGNWYEWRVKPVYLKVVYPFYRIIILPIIAVMCLVVPKNTWVIHWQIPLNRMISHVSSYLIFLTILFFESNLNKNTQKRGPPFSGLEPVILIYVIGYSYSCIRMCAVRGPKRFFKSLWGWYDVICNFFFILTFTFWLVAYVDVINNGDANLERKFWNSLDPTLIAEGTFAIATIMAWCKLLYLCRLNIYLGPLQIVLGKMNLDVAKYISIFVIIMISFTVGMCKFYQYYDGMVQVDDTYEIKTEQVSSFVDFTSTLKTFFWALFCMAPLESADVIIENLPGPEKGVTVTNRHSFTEAIGYIAFAVFEFLTVIVILNMLIATMSHTFQTITDNVDIEWTFGKTEFYLDYMYQTTLPPPFNLIPTGSGILSALEWFRLIRSKGKDSKKAGFSFSHCCYIEYGMDQKVIEEFPVLMSQLVQRYFREKSSGTETAETDLELIRKELLDIKKRVGKRASTILH
ncbi:short transient receptor potential channel 5-like [Agrilus planipennis]|uniref:Short transient receptor potential channel 5-like n=1 Tax=Agrilus planipennis TaxID=224129 RepID=A0A1W4WHA3_AGRPL|nr:short transient receptor potential channel 5-like [Agrilus planipennis]